MDNVQVIKVAAFVSQEVKLDLVSGDLVQVGAKAKLHQVLAKHSQSKIPFLAVLRACLCIVMSYC